MGRRLLMVVGVMLILSGQTVRGQDQKAVDSREQGSATGQLPQIAPVEEPVHVPEGTSRLSAPVASAGSPLPGLEPASTASQAAANAVQEQKPLTRTRTPVDKKKGRLVTSATRHRGEPGRERGRWQFAPGTPSDATAVKATAIPSASLPGDPVSDGPSFACRRTGCRWASKN